jgi:uncharacterized repeat protein (TIGR03803 family)
MDVIFGVAIRMRALLAKMALACLVTLVLIQAAFTQTLTIIHVFSGGADGGSPYAGLIIDNSGNLYGTTAIGGQGNCSNGCGTAFKFTHHAPGWVLTPLYYFQGGSDGAHPEARLTFGPNGRLYGNTCGNVGSCTGPPYSPVNMEGTVFSLGPPPHIPKNILGGWMQTITYPQAGSPSGQLIFDQAGNIYGTNGSCVFELIASGGGWTPSILYCFNGGRDGEHPASGVVMDQAGNLYGTTAYGGGSGYCAEGCGTVFELTPSGSGWTETILHSFQGGNDGYFPFGGLKFDSLGNLYGTTAAGGSGGGTVFTLTSSSGGWAFRQIYALVGEQCEEPPGPYDTLAIDGSGSLYGATYCDDGGGNVFKLVPNPDGSWTYVNIYSLNYYGGSIGGVVLDANGNIFGTSTGGGAYGAVWEIMP